MDFSRHTNEEELPQSADGGGTTTNKEDLPQSADDGGTSTETSRFLQTSPFVSEVPPLNQRSLSADTFSFLISSRLWPCPGKSALLAIGVFLLQLSIFALVCADIIDVENKRNPFNFPPNVEWPVRIAELLAIVVAIITQDDLRKAVNLLRDGYDHDTFTSAFGPEGTRFKWTLSVLFRGFEGLLGLSVTFLLIMQSDQVLDLLLNFSAMEFVSLIDDLVFIFTYEGFFGASMKLEAKALSIGKYHMGPVSGNLSSFGTAAYFILLFAAMLTCWGLIWTRQASGQYLCENLYIQFDDDHLPSLGTLSGLYTLGAFSGFADRVNYVTYGMLGYCQRDKIWTLSVPDDSSQEQHPCDDWIASSVESIAFDITETSSSQWYARTKSGRVLPLEHFYLQCYDCKYDDDFCGDYGSCVENKCECTDDWHGLRCEFEAACSSIEVDPRSEGFVGNRIFASKYYKLDGVELHRRSVYTSSLQNSPVDSIDIMLFTGRRWVLANIGQMPALLDKLSDSISYAETMRKYFLSFHGFHSDYKVDFVSEAVDIDSRTDIIGTPLGLLWHPALPPVESDIQQPDLSRSVDASMLCSRCDNSTNPCQFEATCLADGTCGECPHGSTGVLCQIPPVANARCDPYFNTPDFEYDGGDCCESSCVSTDQVTCGKDESGYIDKGYFHCTQEKANQWSFSGNVVHAVNSAARSGTSVALGGTGGTMLAVGDPEAYTVRLFDKDGSEWIQRGQELEGPANSKFGLAISLSSQSSDVKKNFNSSPSVTLAVGAPEAGLVRVYDCVTNGCVQIGKDITSSIAERKFGASVSLISKGDMLAIGGADYKRCSTGPVEIYTKMDSDWQLHSTVSAPGHLRRNLAASTFELYGYYVSFSTKREDLFLAVGTIKGVDSSSPSCESASLITQVYKWATICPTDVGTEENQNCWKWVPWGERIVKEHFFHRSYALSDSPLKSITLSDDAMVLAIGSNHSVSVYSWNAADTKWLPRKVDVDAIASLGLIGWSVDLSFDGTYLAYVASIDRPENNDDSAHVLKWNGTHYSQFFNGVPAGKTSSVSLSSDGRSLAVGLPLSGNQGGITQVYKFRPLSQCGDDLELLRLSLTTDNEPWNTAWTLQIGNETKESQSYVGMPFTTVVKEFCVPRGECIKFIVHGSRENGLVFPGQYALFLEGEKVASGGQFDGAEIVRIGDCNCPNGTSLLRIEASTNYYGGVYWSISHQHRLANSLNMTRANALIENGGTEIIEECIPNDDCWTLSVFDALQGCQPGDHASVKVFFGGSSIESFQDIYIGVHNINFGGECSSNESIVCSEGSIPVRIEITYYPWLTGWELVDQSSGDIVLYGGDQYNNIIDGRDYSLLDLDQGIPLYEEACKPAETCFNFMLHDSTGVEEFKVFLDGVEIVTDGLIVPIGDACL